MAAGRAIMRQAARLGAAAAMPSSMRRIAQHSGAAAGRVAPSLLPAGALMAAGVVAWGSAPGGNLLKLEVSQDELKKQAGYKAVDEYVRSDMVIGLGTGSTAYFAVERVGQKLKSGELKNVVAIPTSERTKKQAQSLGIPLVTLDTHPKIDVAIDGADAVDPRLNLVKGGGGAHFQEKKVVEAAKQFIVIVDDSKLCKSFGPSFPIPVEIVPFAHKHTAKQIEALPALKGCRAVLRLGSAANNKPDGNKIAVSDNGNYIVDLHFDNPIKGVAGEAQERRAGLDAAEAAKQLDGCTGVVEHGFFIGMATAIVIAEKDGIVLKKKPTMKRTGSQSAKLGGVPNTVYR